MQASQDISALYGSNERKIRLVSAQPVNRLLSSLFAAVLMSLFFLLGNAATARAESRTLNI